VPAGQDPIWLYLPVVIDPGKFGCDRDEAARRLARLGLKVRKYYSPACHTLSTYRSARAQPLLPVSERIAQGVLALPVYNDMTAEECDGIVEAFRRTAGAKWDQS
jgi:dTDP-4-amino-4,6-dideoxygalactose transaminase